MGTDLPSSGDQSTLTPYQLQEHIFKEAWPYWRQKFEASEELERFLLGDRYVDDQGEFNRDRRGVQIRGQETDDTISHVVAKATEKPRSVEGRPVDTQMDPHGEMDRALAEAKVALISNKLADPYVGFERERYKAMMACQRGRRAVVWMDWVPECGPYGKVLWSFQQQGSVMWDPAYHPHHPLCQWLIRHKRVDYRKANRDYGVHWIKPDYFNLVPHSTQFRPGVPLMAGFTDRIAHQAIRDERATIRELWIKNDPTENPNTTAENKRQVLKPDDRYMSCVSQCGYRSLPQGAMRRKGLISKALPDRVAAATHPDDAGGCPRCGGALMRIDAKDISRAQLLYAKGRRMIVASPFSPGPNGQEHLYDGAWPIPTARSFPALFLFASVNPGDETGGRCLVDKMWDQQVASDNLQTLAIQRVFEHRDYWRMPTVGFYNARGDRFEFRDDDENVIFEDVSKTNKYGPRTIEHIAGTGLDSAWIQIYGVVNSSLTKYRPQADIELTPQNSRDIPVGTIQTMVEQGEVTTRDFIRRCNEELSMTYGVYDDYLSATMTPDELQRMNIEGTDVLMKMWGDSMPNYDYVISETPDFVGVDPDKQKAWDAAIQAGIQLGPEALDAWAQFHNAPASVLRSIKKLFAEKQAATAKMGALVPPSPGPGTASSGGDAPIQNGAGAPAIPAGAVP